MLLLEMINKEQNTFQYPKNVLSKWQGKIDPHPFRGISVFIK